MNENNSNQSLSLIDHLVFFTGLILQRKLFIIIITLISMIGIVGFSIATLMLPPEKSPLPNVYQSTAVIRFQSSPSALSMESLLASVGGSQGNRNSVTDMSTVVQYVLMSNSFVDQLVQEFDLINRLGIMDNQKKLSRMYVRNTLTNVYNRNTGMMTISARSIDPVFARNFVNKTVELLQNWFLDEGGTIRSRQMELLEGRLSETQSQIKELESQIKAFQTKYGVLSVEELAKQLEDIISDLQSQLVQVDMEIQQYSQYARIEDPSLTRYKAQRQNILSMIDQLNNGYSINGRKLPTREELSDLFISFNRISMDLKIQQDIYQSLAQRYEVLRLAAIEESVFSVLELGEIPEEKIGPSRGKLCITVTLVAFFGSMALVIGVYFLRRMLNDPKIARIFKSGGYS